MIAGLAMITLLYTPVTGLANVTVNTTLKEVSAWWNMSAGYSLLQAAKPPGSSFAYSMQSNYSLLGAGKPAESASLNNASLNWAGQVCANISNTVTCYELNGSYKPPVTTITETQTTTAVTTTTITRTVTGPGGQTTVITTVETITIPEQQQGIDRSRLLVPLGIAALLILLALAGGRRR